MYLYMNECNDIYFLCPFIFFLDLWFIKLQSILEDNDELLEDKELLLLLLLPLVLVS